MKITTPLPALLALMLTALAPLDATAGVYKCMVNGKLVYSDRKCMADSTPINSNPALGNLGADGGSRPGYNRRVESLPQRGYRAPGDGRDKGSDKEADKATVIGKTDDETKQKCETLKRWKLEAAKNGGSAHGKKLHELEDMEFSLCFGHVNGAP